MSHCTHWTPCGEECCDCGHVFPHDDLLAATTTACPILPNPQLEVEGETNNNPK